MATIYEITDDILFINKMIEQGEIDPEALKGALAVSKEELSLKLENYCKCIKNFESDIKGLKDEENRLAAKRKTLEEAIDRMKRAMEWSLKETLTEEDDKKMKCGTFTCAMQKNTPSVVLDCEDGLVPDKYLVPQPPKVDRILLKEDIDGGVDLSGIAHLEQSESIRIR